MKAGRPTDYTPDMPDRLMEYLEAGNAKNFPTKAGFAVEVGVCRDTLHEWATKKDDGGCLVYPEFSDAYKRVKDYQEKILVQAGLNGEINTPFGIFTAKNVLDWGDRTEHEIYGKGGGAITTQVITFKGAGPDDE